MNVVRISFFFFISNRGGHGRTGTIISILIGILFNMNG